MTLTQEIILARSMTAARGGGLITVQTAAIVVVMNGFKVRNGLRGSALTEKTVSGGASMQASTVTSCVVNGLSIPIMLYTTIRKSLAGDSLPRHELMRRSIGF